MKTVKVRPADDGDCEPEVGTEKVELEANWRLALREFAANRLAMLGLGVLVLIVLGSFAGPLFYRTNQTDLAPLEHNLPPGPGHPLGTDQSGFDVLGRIMVGGQATLEIAFCAALISVIIGTIYGTIAGLAGGVVDAVMMRILDTWLAIPFLFVILILSTKFNGSVLTISLVLGSYAWLVPARVIRGEILTLRTREYVHAARGMDAGSGWIISRHLLPNSVSVLVVNVTMRMAEAILAVAFMGFLGVGLPFPEVSWGDMLSSAQTNLANGVWWTVYPVGICVVLVIVGINFFGDGLRDVFDVRLRRR